MDRFLSLFETPLKAGITSLITGLLGGFTLFVTLFFFLYWQEHRDDIAILETRVAALDTDLKAYRGKEFDIAAALTRQTAAEAQRDAKEAELKAAVADKEAALARLDADKDGVEIPEDLCPNSDPKGGATAVNSKGCLDIEIADSCNAVPFHPFDSKEKWVFSEDCELSEDPILQYSCTAEYVTGSGWKIQECSAFDPTQGG